MSDRPSDETPQTMSTDEPATAVAVAEEEPKAEADGYTYNTITEDDLGSLSFDDAIDQTIVALRRG